MMRRDFRKLDAIIRDLPARADAMLRGAAGEITAEIVGSFGDAPSAPGHPPGIVTGHLQESIHWERVGALRYTISDGVPYGALLELGSARMAARPFMAPILESWRQRRLAEYVQEFGLL
jgi:hypothetical protein